MSIELHCPQCQKLIRAPDDAGGKRGKCPYCKNTVYIPTPPDEREAIPIAPLDEDEEKKLEEMRRESVRYAAAVDHAKAGDLGPERDAPRGAGRKEAAAETVDLDAEVEHFIRSMHTSKLDEAEAVVARLQQLGSRSRDFVEGLFVDEMPLEVENVPQPLVKGFLKTLLNRLE